jgi:tetratricopeptide (TPR) repeat protein
LKGSILRTQGHPEEAVAEHERAVPLDPSNMDAVASLGFDHHSLGEFDKSLEYLDKAILASVRSGLAYWSAAKPGTISG